MIRCLSLIALTVFVVSHAGPGHAQGIDDSVPRRELGFIAESGDEKTKIVVSANIGVTPIVNPVEVTVTVDTLPWYLVTFPHVRGEWGAFKVVKEIKVPKKAIRNSGDQLHRSQRRYILEPTEPGFHSMPTLLLSILDSSNLPSVACVYREECKVENFERGYTVTSEFMRTAPIAIEVTSVLPPDADITKPKDILPPVTLLPPPPTPIVWQPYAIVAACILTTILLGLWLRQRLSQSPRAKPVPMAPAHELALAALANLEDMRFATAEEIDIFHVRLSAIFRRYLDWRFGLRAAERTTDEVVSAIAEPSAVALVAMQRELTQNFLKSCDQVKFARHQPGGEESRGLLTVATSFIQETADANARVALTRAAEVS
jgi:hypothetical protein